MLNFATKHNDPDKSLGGMKGSDMHLQHLDGI